MCNALLLHTNIWNHALCMAMQHAIVMYLCNALLQLTIFNIVMFLGSCYL